jgi:uncharacterized membrane protein
MIIDRVKNILLTPKQEWPVIEPEPTTPAQLYTGYIIPLAALSAVLTLIRMSIIGVSVPFMGSLRMPFFSSLTSALVTFGFSLLGLYIVALIINGLAPTFGGVRDQRQALKTAAYAFTPAWLASVLGLLPAPLSSLLSLLAGLYGIYLLYLGLPVVMKAPIEKAVGYTVTVVVCTILVGIVLGALMAAFGFGRMGGMGGYGYGAFHGMSGQSEDARQAGAAAMAGALVGNVLGTDEKGKEGLAKAMAQMAAAGRQMEEQQKAVNARASDAPAASAQASAGTDAAAMSPATATARLASAVGGALGGEHRVDPVDFHTLKAMLPESIAGMKRTGSAGSNQQALGVKTSNATADYQGAGDARLHVKIADISGVSGLLGVAGALGQMTDSESDTGFEKDTTIGGRQFHEKFQNAGKHGELTTIVAQRFEVDVTGDGTDMNSLEQAAGSIDFAHLEGMKNQGAQPN